MRAPDLQLRLPGGTGSNIWDPKAGHFLPDRIPAVTPARAYAKYRGFMPFIDDLPTGTLSAAHFVQGLGGTARRVVWDLNVFVFNASEACGQIESARPYLYSHHSTAAIPACVCSHPKSTECTSILKKFLP